MNYSSMAVFCGSKSGTNPKFETHARTLGNLLAERGIELIYGGGNKGLMGAVADAALGRGGKVTGIIPKILTEWEHQHDALTELIVVEDMHIRKHLLYQKCDAAIILPGGYGTLDELFEVLTWNQLKIHSKPIFLLNTDGFYDSLLDHIRNMEAEQFLYTRLEETITIVNEPAQIFD